jgi:hypothetical protein
MSRDDNSEPQGYLISQADLEKYQRLERELQQLSARMGKFRRSLMSRMGGRGRVEPGPLTLQVAYQDTGLTTTDEYGDETPVLARRLIVYQVAEDPGNAD